MITINISFFAHKPIFVDNYYTSALFNIFSTIKGVDLKFRTGGDETHDRGCQVLCS